MDDTRQRILDTALRAFAARGYDAVGVQEICANAGISKPSLYHHFGSKLGLLDAIASERYAPFVASFADRSRYHGDLAASLVGGMETFLEAGRLDPDFARLRVSLSFAPRQSEQHRAMRTPAEQLFESARRIFVAASRDHGNMKGRDLPYAASFLGTADAYVNLLLSGDLDPDKEFVRRVVHHFMHGLFS